MILNLLNPNQAPSLQKIEPSRLHVLKKAYVLISKAGFLSFHGWRRPAHSTLKPLAYDIR